MNYIAERRLEERDRRRNEILDAAEAVSRLEGIGGLTMEQVARQARLSRALIYVYFKDKTDLHFGLCERGLAVLLERFNAARTRHRTGREQLSAIGRAYVAFAQEFPVYYDALAQFQLQDASAPGMADRLQPCLGLNERVFGVMVSAIEQGRRDGSISAQSGSAIAVAIALWGFMHGIIQLSITKAAVLNAAGLNARGLFEQALALIDRALQPAAD